MPKVGGEGCGGALSSLSNGRSGQKTLLRDSRRKYLQVDARLSPVINDFVVCVPYLLKDGRGKTLQPKPYHPIQYFLGLTRAVHTRQQLHTTSSLSGTLHAPWIIFIKFQLDLGNGVL